MIEREGDGQARRVGSGRGATDIGASSGRRGDHRRAPPGSRILPSHGHHRTRLTTRSSASSARATDAEIKRAFRKLAQQWHPDVNTDPEAAGAVQGDQRGLPGPVRPGAPPALRHVRAGRRRRRRRRGCAGFEGFGGFSDIFDAFFGGGAGAAAARRGRPQPGADLRYDLRITFEEAVHGTEKEIEFPRPRAAARRAAAAAPNPGTEPITCPQCNGRGEVRSVRQTMLGQMVNVSACPRCHGEGKIVETPCETCHGEGRIGAQADAPRHDPGRHRRGPPDPPLERGRGRAARRPAGQPVRRRPRRAAPVAEARGDRALLRGRGLDRPGGARDEDHGPDGRRRGGGRDQGRAPSRAPRSGCAARACRTCAGAGTRGDLHVMVDVVVPTKLDEAPARAARADARGRGAARPVHESGGLRREARARVTPATGRRPTEQAAAGAGAWLELAVEADVEAVEAVSEILGRVAPGGTSRRAGLRARRRGARARASTRPGRRPSGPTCRPATRPPPSGRSPRSPRRSAISRRSGCGRSASSGRGSSTRPTGPRPGRRTSRSCASAGGSSSGRPGGATGARRTTSSSRSTRGWPSGPASIRRRGCASRPSRRWRTAARSTARASSTSAAARGILAIAAVKLGAASALGVDTDPIADRGDAARTPGATASPAAIRAREGSLPSGEPAVRRRPREPHRRRARPARAGAPRRAAAGRRRCSRRASSSTARRRSATAFEAAGLGSIAADAEGDWVALEARRPA